MNPGNVVKILLIVVVTMFILILVIKRFVYFRPGTKFIDKIIDPQELYEGYLHGWLVSGTNGFTILFCHGNGGNISHRQWKIIALNKMGFSVLIFDYTGYGKSKGGIPNEHQMYRDADLYLSRLLEETRKDKIIVYGESMGAAVGAHLARKHGLKYLIIESGLPGIGRLVRTRFPWLLFVSFLFYEFNTEQYLRGYSGKVLTLHSVDDENIPFKSIEKVRGLSSNFIEMTGSHNDPEIPWNKIYDTLKIWLGIKD